ncbi:protein arginine kinase [Ruficoccus amylovorans]|uniref:Protein arginine kinase n=1 Tax=Ruficoccus amylovorans TaxID=1804625 RepID=A0A842HJP9_9BACT|nr:protein arginine kinase [Ruficoccus amylovorans]MBC2596188.1 protein arginine kinase [Ruficoccus amylovorans]
MTIKPLLDANAELTSGGAPGEPIVMSSRIRLARNLDGRAFPGWAKKAQRREILSACEKAVAQLPQMQNGTVLRLDDLSELERQVLVERHLISRELSQGEPSAGVIISRDQACSIMINEEDHLRIQVLRTGHGFDDIWKVIEAIDNRLETLLDFAFTAQLGYLTACPTNLGTGMRASVMLHLPGLVMANHMEKVIRAVNQMGMVVRGLFGEGSDATGSIFQISNQQTLGESEQEIIARLEHEAIGSIIEQEKNARALLLESKPEKIRDKIGRAYGILQNGHLLSSAEAMSHLSLLRLGIDCGFIAESWRGPIDRLLIEMQPGHIQLAAHESIESDMRDTARARLLREETRRIPPLDFET